MTLEQMASDLEWSKKLGHLFEKEAEWWWYVNEGKIYIAEKRKPSNNQLYPAIFTEDALRMLPREFQKAALESYFVRNADKKLANCVCKMIEWCLENGVELK